MDHIKLSYSAAELIIQNAMKPTGGSEVARRAIMMLNNASCNKDATSSVRKGSYEDMLLSVMKINTVKPLVQTIVRSSHALEEVKKSRRVNYVCRKKALLVHKNRSFWTDNKVLPTLPYEVGDGPYTNAAVCEWFDYNSRELFQNVRVVRNEIIDSVETPLIFHFVNMHWDTKDPLGGLICTDAYDLVYLFPKIEQELRLTLTDDCRELWIDLESPHMFAYVECKDHQCLYEYDRYLLMLNDNVVFVAPSTYQCRNSGNRISYYVGTDVVTDASLFYNRDV